MGQTDRIEPRQDTRLVDCDGVWWIAWLGCPYCGATLCSRASIVGQKWSDVHICDTCGNEVANGEASISWVEDDE